MSSYHLKAQAPKNLSARVILRRRLVGRWRRGGRTRDGRMELLEVAIFVSTDGEPICVDEHGAVEDVFGDGVAEAFGELLMVVPAGLEGGCRIDARQTAQDDEVRHEA